MTEIVLFRHGKCKFNVRGRVNGRFDSELSPGGKQQARLLARRLANPAVRELVPLPSESAIFTSPLQRASSTGRIVTSHLGLPEPQPLDLLVERDLGQVTGMTFAEAGAIIDEEDKIRAHGITYAHAKKYGFETFDEATERGAQCIDTMKQACGRRGVVWAFTHGDFALAVTAAWTGRPMMELIHELYLDNTDVLCLGHDRGFAKIGWDATPALSASGVKINS